VCEELERRGHTVRELRLEGIARELVADLMAAADVLALSSLSEGTPVAIMEALASGLPVVATAVGDVPSMLAGAPSRVVAPFSVTPFADAVESLLREVVPAPRVGASQAARFDLARICARLMEIYGHVLGAGGVSTSDVEGEVSAGSATAQARGRP
jgi:glycosyltransferase involved in cell wall biosynthesis